VKTFREIENNKQSKKHRRIKMKLKTWAAFAALITLLGLSPACSKLGVETTAKNPVEQLVTLCKEDNLKEAAKHMRYPGMDKAKKDETANYESGDADEKRQIEMSCKRFKALSTMNYTVSPERSEQGFNVYDVEVKEGTKTNKQLWAFRKSGNDYVLVDID
jgi:hypothetical protein